ncbi:hypothetical protein LJB95_03370, partial [Paludibacteraceae bacterium OttesenSCG-928-F17]|nr:hypothetical protein [Paludibacteraceae bacterium OttesenSCG-928-F17]
KFTPANTDIVEAVINNKTIVLGGEAGTTTIKVESSNGKFSETVTVTVDALFAKEPYNVAGGMLRDIRDYHGGQQGTETNKGGDIVYMFQSELDDMQYQYYVTSEYVYMFSIMLFKDANKYEKFARKYMDKKYKWEGWDALDARFTREIYTVPETGTPAKEISYTFLCEEGATGEGCQLQISYSPNSPAFKTETLPERPF